MTTKALPLSFASLFRRVETFCKNKMLPHHPYQQRNALASIAYISVHRMKAEAAAERRHDVHAVGQQQIKYLFAN
jgi:hypothetical protein